MSVGTFLPPSCGVEGRKFLVALQSQGQNSLTLKISRGQLCPPSSENWADTLDSHDPRHDPDMFGPKHEYFLKIGPNMTRAGPNMPI